MRDAVHSLIPLWVTPVASFPASFLLKLEPMRPCRVGKLDTSQETAWEMLPGILAVGYRAELIEAVPALLRISVESLNEIQPGQVSLPFNWVWPERQLNSYRWWDLARALCAKEVTT